MRLLGGRLASRDVEDATRRENSLHGPCLVLPTSTDPQEGRSAEWAHELSLSADGRRSWVICNHLYTVSPSRLSQVKGKVPRVPEDEFGVMLSKVFAWLPKPHQG